MKPMSCHLYGPYPYEERGKTRTRVFRKTARIFQIYLPRKPPLLDMSYLGDQANPHCNWKNPSRLVSHGTMPPITVCRTHIQNRCVHGAVHGLSHFHNHYFGACCPGTAVAAVPLRSVRITCNAAIQSLVVCKALLWCVQISNAMLTS